MKITRRTLLGSSLAAGATLVSSSGAAQPAHPHPTPPAPTPPAPVVQIPRPVDSENETTGVYLPFTDDDERTSVDEPVFLHDGVTSTKRDTIPMPPRKE